MDAGCVFWQILFSTLILFGSKMTPKWIAYDALGDQLKTFVQHKKKWMEAITGMFSGRAPVFREADMPPKWMPCGQDFLSSQC